jgi:FlaA1/EpsC-like NDP-sugar epimerase
MIKNLFNFRSLFAFAHDVSAAAIAWLFAFLLRFNFEIPNEYFSLMMQNFFIILPFQMISFLSFGLYRGVWRFASTLDIKRIFFAINIGLFLFVAFVFMVFGISHIPRSVFILYPILLMFMMSGNRLIYRMVKEYFLFGHFLAKGESLIVIGSGEAVISLLKDLNKSNEWRVVGILDNDKTMHGREILGVKVLGAIASLPEIAHRFNLNRVIITMPSSRTEWLKAFNLATKIGLEVYTVPAIGDLISGRLNVSKIRRVEVEDLLARNTVELDNSGLHHLIRGNSVLVSGAGGSIGSELCRQILLFNPSNLICLDISEYALYQLEQDLISKGLSEKILYIVGDVRNANRLDQLLKNHHPKVVFHAAAYKHVPLMETGNVSEALNNNVLGTYTLAKACKRVKVDKFVLVSTDKAVNPTNVMGATKRLAELVCQGLQDKKGTNFVIVRFGNVLGSSGSVVPKFREQIKAGGPVTVTHPEVTRYFMSIPEAAQLVMQACLIGQGSQIFVLDMGEPVKIADLARNMIKLSGFTEDEIRVVFSGLRPGEKLYEELLADDEKTLPTSHKKLFIASSVRAEDEQWVSALLDWLTTTLEKDEQLIKEELKAWVEEYRADTH